MSIAMGGYLSYVMNRRVGGWMGGWMGRWMSDERTDGRSVNRATSHAATLTYACSSHLCQAPSTILA